MFVIIIVAVLALCLALIIAIAHDNGPGPGRGRGLVRAGMGPSRLRCALDPVGRGAARRPRPAGVRRREARRLRATTRAPGLGRARGDRRRERHVRARKRRWSPHAWVFTTATSSATSCNSSVAARGGRSSRTRLHRHRRSRPAAATRQCCVVSASSSPFTRSTRIRHSVCPLSNRTSTRVGTVVVDFLGVSGRGRARAQ